MAELSPEERRGVRGGCLAALNANDGVLVAAVLPHPAPLPTHFPTT